MTAHIPSERLIIGALLRTPDMIWTVRERLKPEMMTDGLCKKALEAIIALTDEGKKASLPLVRARIADTEDAGSMLAALMVVDDEAPVYDLIDEVSESWRRAHFQRKLEKALKDLKDPAKQTDMVLEDVEAVVGSMSAQAHGAIIKPIAEVISRIMNKERVTAKVLPKFDTGLYALDEICGPLRGGDLIAIAGAPGEGKTLLGGQIAIRAAETARVAFFQLEMSDEALTTRFLSASSALPARDIEDGGLNRAESEILQQSIADLSRRGMMIIDQPKMTWPEIASAARAMKRTDGLGMICIDHLKLVKHPNGKLSKWDRMEEVCTEAKALAKELGIVVMILAQRTQESLKREDATPLLTDIDGGGALAQFADLVLCLFRRDRWMRQRYFGGKSPDMDQRESKRGREYYESLGMAEVHVLKRRRGEDGQMRQFRFNGAASRLDPADAR